MPMLSWYWHRLRAMSPGEIALHMRRKMRAFIDAGRAWDASAVKLECSKAFPRLPKPEEAPEVLRAALRRDAQEILAGRWKAFGHLDLQVDDPPKWHTDYLAGQNLATNESAFKLDYRELAGGADIKLIWELSRWHQLTRLAMAAYVLADERAAARCIEWLEDWVKHNPPYRGWNWTSALEAGMRLVQFTWIDALLSSRSRGDEALTNSERGTRNPELDPSLLTSAATREERLERLRREILPPHVWFAWRHKSFGSSANNHLMGELAGLILATVRWPTLAPWGASLEELQSRWEPEVLAQFAEDGGNKEQALNYHLFSWEFCWQARMAIRAAGREPDAKVEGGLARSARFFCEVQSRREHWDYGDSDNGFVSPFFASAQSAVSEWWDWLANSAESASIRYWLGDAPRQPRPLGRGPPLDANAIGGWWHYRDSGIAISESGMWWLRWDVSRLGYLSTAAHGHLDALHLSVWYKGVALIIDPGTGAYYADRRLRDWLASRAAHNGPCPSQLERPRRLGSFLWAQHHPVPTLDPRGANGVVFLNHVETRLRRQIVNLPEGRGWRVEDECIGKGARPAAFTTRWQFAPGSWVKRLGERKFSLHRAEVALVIEVDGDWSEVELVELGSAGDRSLLMSAAASSFEGIVSPAFRKVCRAPYLKLVARPQGDKPCVFRTTFLASAS